ncbi:hypothetical protein DFJ63DRAFT_315324 [Scheffersomyces coipomensis]|uniref:uncharacterized protein n=1 Tax=Scheffersomyces coipomensis TaxID=1788519 RepID=UPI00315D93DD
MVILSSYLKPLFNPFILIFQLLWRIFWSGLNQKSLIRFLLNYWINFSPVFIWLLIFKNAGLIPKSIRPHIFVKLAYRVDERLFNFFDFPLENLALVICCGLVSYLLYWKVYGPIGKNTSSVPTSEHNDNEVNQPFLKTYEVSPSHSFELTDVDSTSSSVECQNSTQNEENISSETLTIDDSPSDLYDEDDPNKFMDLVYFKHRRYTPNNTKLETIIETRQQQSSSNPYRPLNNWYLTAPLLLSASWFILNFDYYLFREPIHTPKDILAWFSYVIGHFCAPLFTAIWLYVFHAPGSLKLFSIALGVQNIAGVLTHLSFPNAPPWFIHLYGENSLADYDMPGYAAGLTRVDVAMGTHLNTNGFHASPIVFGALPSLHSAMAVMVFFFLSYYSRWTFVKLIGLSFVILQWWATMYLDHHWRLDLFVGMCYSIVMFSILQPWLRNNDKRFMMARLRKDYLNSHTMGMRVFKNTWLESFFDPLYLADEN